MTVTNRSPRWIAGLALAVCVGGLTTGCGSKDNRVSGQVTFQGKPIPAGKIYFNHDASKSPGVAPGYADIKNGAYDTAAEGGRGVANGSVSVVIEGFDPSAEGKKEKGDTSGETTIKALFPAYETTAEISGNTTKDFDVPAEAATKPKKKAPAMIVP